MKEDKQGNIVLHQCEEDKIEDSRKNQKDTIHSSSSDMICIIDITNDDNYTQDKQRCNDSHDKHY